MLNFFQINPIVFLGVTDKMVTEKAVSVQKSKSAHKNKIINNSSSGSWYRFGFLHKNRFLLSTVKLATIRKTIGLIWKFLCVIPRCIRNFDYFKVFIFEHGSVSKKFIFTDCSVLTDSAFSFAFSLLLFFVWFSLLHKVSVALVDVPKCWLCLCHGWTWIFYYALTL